MKFTAFAAIAASAALVSAVPLRVVVVSPGDAQELKPLSLRFGLPAAGATVARPAMDKPVAYPAHARPCGGRFRQKSIEFSNALRKAFGFPTIEDHQVFPSASVASVKLNGVTTFIEGPEIMYAGNPGWRGKAKGGDRVHIVEWTPEGPPPPFPPHRGGPPPPGFPPHRNGVPPPPPPHHGHYHHHPHSHHGPSGEPFLGRVQNAFLSLGPWEGRVVAFVLGCGIGVLLRMIWVLGLIMVRSFRGTNETHHYVLVVEGDEDNSRATPVSAPPAYVYPVDEKVAAEETDAKKAQPADN